MNACKLPAVVFFALILINFPVWAVEPFNIQGIYKFTWNGLPVGKLKLTATESGKDFHVITDIGSGGILSLFTKHESHAESKGTRGASYGASARIYETHYKTKKKPRHIKVVYGAGGKVLEEVVEPEESAAKRVLFDDVMKTGVADPLIFVLDLREAIAASLKEGKKKFDIKLYDGKRLTETHWTRYGEETRKVNNAERKLLKLGVTRTPLAGFTKEELKDMKGEPELFFYVSNDDNLMPLYLHASVTLGILEATFVETTP